MLARTELQFIPGVPTQLNRMLAKGDIDIAPISSIAYARNHKQLALSRHLCISSFGAVDSILLLSKKPITDISSVSLTTQSATSVALLKTILKLRFQLEVEYFSLENSVSEALTKHDAVLLIGDQALEALYFPESINVDCKDNKVSFFDLGELWQEWTGYPMVYAVWAARKDFFQTNDTELLTVENELVLSMNYGREHLPQVVEGAMKRSRFDKPALERYFTILRYEFTSEYRQGLLRFYELAHEAGELEEVPELQFITKEIK